MLSYAEEIAKLESSLENIKKPAAVIEGTVFEYRQAVCETHGEFQQLVRSMKALGSLQTKTSCPSCLMERLQSLKEKQEFYQLIDYTDDVDLHEKLAEWEAFYNCHRPHSAHGGKTPYEVLKTKLGM